MRKTMVGIILIVVAFVGIIGWELIGREAIVYTDALVLTEDVEAYEVISEDMLASRKVYQPVGDIILAKDAEDIIGKEAVQFIPKGAELYSAYFEEQELAVNPDNGDYVFSIESSALTAYPRSIKKGDKVYFYDEDGEFAQAVIIGLKNAAGEEINRASYFATGEGDIKIETIELKVNDNVANKLARAVNEKDDILITYNKAKQ